MTFEPNELILEGYGNPIEKNDEEGWLETDTTSTEDNDVKGWFETDTTSTLKKKYDAMRDSIDNKSMKMENWVDKMDSTHMDKKDNMQWNDSLKNVKKDMWKKDMKHDMDTTKDHKDLNHQMNDTIKKLNNGVIDMK